MTDKINTTETGISIWEVVGIDDLEGNTFAQCTCKENAEKALDLLERQGFEDVLEVRESNLLLDKIELGGSIIPLSESVQSNKPDDGNTATGLIHVIDELLPNTYKVLDGDADTIFVFERATGKHYEIKVSELAD